MNESPDPHPGDSSPDHLDAVARQLQAALHDAAPSAIAADAATIDTVRQGARRRRRARVGATAALAAVVLLGGLAVVATRDDRSTRALVVGQPDSMASTEVVPTSVSTADPNATTGAPETLGLDPGTTGAPGSTDPASPTTSGHGPITTIAPPGSSTPTTATPTGPRNCGSYSPSGWPTTFVYSPDAAQCLLDGFNTGTTNTFHLVIADTYYDGLTHDHLITEDYTIVGVHAVHVRVDRTLADAAPKTIVTYRCTQLTYQYGAGAVYHYGSCTVVG